MVYNSGLVFGSGDEIYRLVAKSKMPSPQRCFYEEDAVKHGMALDSAPVEKFREDVI